MNSLIPILHWLGTKPLTVSLAAQAVVIALAITSKEKGQLIQSLVLSIGLVLAVVSISLRPPAPVRLLPDALGTGATLFFLAPAAQSLLKLRKSQKNKDSD